MEESFVDIILNRFSNLDIAYANKNAKDLRMIFKENGCNNNNDCIKRNDIISRMARNSFNEWLSNEKKEFLEQFYLLYRLFTVNWMYDDGVSVMEIINKIANRLYMEIQNVYGEKKISEKIKKEKRRNKKRKRKINNKNNTKEFGNMKCFFSQDFV